MRRYKCDIITTMKYHLSIGTIAAMLVIGAFVLNSQSAPVAHADSAGPYKFTSTKAGDGTAIAQTTQLKTGFGVLGSVIVEGATAGQSIYLYDATTSDVTKRALATSSLPVVIIPSTAPGGTLKYDVAFTNGLILNVVGATGTSTVTWQ